MFSRRYLVLAVLTACVAFPQSGSVGGVRRPVYLDARAPVDDRVADLLARMTIQEKIGQVDQRFAAAILQDGVFHPAKAHPVLIDLAVGCLRALAKGSGDRDGKSAALYNEVQRYVMDHARLRIPLLVQSEALHGHVTLGATIFPQPIGMGATWHPEMVYRIGRAIAAETRAVGTHHVTSPTLGLARDARWGRTEETFGSDPFLTSRMAEAMVKGLQGRRLSDPDAVAATLKHFIAHSVPEGGRDSAPAPMSERTLRDTFLPPFQAGIDAGAACIMAAYHALNGVPCSASRWLLTDFLRGELGFRGFVISDMGSMVHPHRRLHTAATDAESVSICLHAGVDMNMADGTDISQCLKTGLAKGYITEKDIDIAAGRILRLKFLLGLFERPYVDPDHAAKVVDSTEHRRLALQAARESIVLLKNEDALLPLDKTRLTAVAVIGPNADVARHGHYSPKGTPSVTVLEGIQKKLGGDVEVLYAKGCTIPTLQDYSQEKLREFSLWGNDDEEEAPGGFSEAVAVTERADVAVVVVGGNRWTTGEVRDRANLDLIGRQNLLIRTLHATGKPIVLVHINGRPNTMEWAADHLPAILTAWYPGEEGGTAIADVLFGDFNPCGRLPMNWPRSVGQSPMTYDFKPFGRGRGTGLRRGYVATPLTPRWPFGHGLSYTRFEYADLRVSPSEIRDEDRVTVSVRVKNSGARPGTTVVPLYVRDVLASLVTPFRRLKGFVRVHLEPGEIRDVVMEIPMQSLAIYPGDAFHVEEPVVEPGRFEVMIHDLKAEFRKL